MAGGVQKQRRLRPGGWGLFASSAAVLGVGLVVTAAIWIGLTLLFRRHWPWDRALVAGKAVNELDITKVALSVVAGVGAAIALTVTYRRQRDAERSRFDERFAAAAAQLGGASPAERLAGVYAIATMADETPERRQQCINLLCAYLRLPYDPSAGLLSSVVSEHTWPIGTASGREQRTYQRLPNDREVRLAIIDVIRAHLQPAAPVPWQGYDFDFTGAVFDGGNFAGAQFTGGVVDFAGAQFTGGMVNFLGAHFAGRLVNFRGAQFTGGVVDFAGAQFTGGMVNFFTAHFAGRLVNFRGAQFTGGVVDFLGAQFTGGMVNFADARFTGSTVNFHGAQFTGGTVTFFTALFTGGVVDFRRAQFTGGTVSLRGARFTGGTVNFSAQALRAVAPPDLSEAIFGGGEVWIGDERLLTGPPTEAARASGQDDA